VLRPFVSRQRLKNLWIVAPRPIKFLLQPLLHHFKIMLKRGF